MAEKKYRVVGIGNAIVDIIARVEDQFLKDHKLVKGSMMLVDQLMISELHQKINVSKQISGGSVANTIAGLAVLGDPVAFIGKVNNDLLGETFEKGLKDLGVHYSTRKSMGSNPTGSCIVLTTPDAQRTMNTCLGISGSLDVNDIDDEIISDSKVVYLEGYLWDKKEAKEAFLKAIGIAHAKGVKVALSLSDSFCVERHRKEFLNLIKNHIDVLFANEDEIISLFESKSFNDALIECRKHKLIFVLTRADKGSIVVSGGKKIIIPAEKNVKVIDTTGAGDLFAAGFLHGYTLDKSLEDCARMGSILAAEIITQIGARLRTPLSDILKKKGFKKCYFKFS